MLNSKQPGKGKALIWLLSFLFVYCLSGYALAAEGPGYIVTGSLEGSRMTVEINIEHVNAWSGKLALQYNPEQLELEKGNSINSTVKGAAGIDITLEGEPFEEMVSETQGYVTFAWSTQGVNTLDASAKAQPVATVSFRLKDGVAQGDLNQKTLRLRNLREGEIADWASCASIFAKGSVIYEYNVDSMPACNASIDYPNCGVVPVDAYEVTFVCRDQEGKPLAANILVDNQPLKTDTQGKATLRLTDGSYGYKAAAAGYSSVIGTLTVAGQAKTEQVVLQNHQQLVDSIAQNLTITYAAGDSANRVTKSLTLQKTGKDNATIGWSSSNQNVINTYGGVFPQNTKQIITLTATVKKAEATAQKQFTLTVPAKASIGGQEPQTVAQGTAPSSSQPNAAAGKFTDLGFVPWAEEAIYALAEAGVINGTSETTFDPGKPIKRGDFTALLVRLLAPEGEAGEAFTDVPPDSYYYTQITLARGLGIAQGSVGNRFQPEAAISRQDMMVLTARALVLTGVLPEDSSEAIGLTPFADHGQIAAYAKDSVSRMVSEGFIAGDAQKRLTPLSNTTRAETAVFLYRIYQRL